jgi:hypothetical protein
MPENTLIGRCTVAYEEAFNDALQAWPDASARRRGVAAVIEHLAAELLVMHQRNEGRLSARDAAQLLLLEDLR